MIERGSDVAVPLSTARYEGLVRAAPADVWWADGTGRLLADLPQWRRHTGQRPEDLLGEGWLDAVRDDQRLPVATAWREAVASRAPFEAEFPIVSPDGGERAVVVRAQPVAQDGQPLEWLGTVSTVDRRSDHFLRLEVRTAETLRGLSAALVSDLDLERVLQHVTDAATQLIDAEVGAFVYNVPDGGGELHKKYVSSGGLLDDFPTDPSFDGNTIVRMDDLTAELGGQDQPVRSYLAVPVVSRTGEVLGGLFFGHREAGRFTPEHERLITGVAAPAAIAIDNACLYQAAQRERDVAQRLAARLAAMQTVSARLAGAKVVDEVATVIVNGAAAALGADRASLFLVEDDERGLRLLHSFGYEGRLRQRWGRMDLDARLPATDALRARQLMVLTDSHEWTARYPEVVMGHPGEHSEALAVIPLALGEQIFGVATFGWDAPRRFEDDDIQYLESLRDQCSQALERARLYEVERETARTLQRSLLPPHAPEIPGMDVAAVYRAGDRSVEVGGDFYDIFRLGPNRWGVAMGDVCGRGAQAAARTALVRYTLRAVASQQDGPVEVLRRLNQLVLAEPDADDRFCATVFGDVELDRCGAWVTLACAGHPRPIVLRRAGWIDLRGQPGTLVGVVEDINVSPDRVGLGPGDALVFFTDGISEARNALGEQFADERLPDTLLASVDLDATAIAERVRRSALEFAGGTLGDDLAVLVLRVPPEAADDPDGWLEAALGPLAATTDVPGYPVPHGGQTTRPLPPREARILLPALPTSSREARRFLAGVLVSWRMPEMLEGDAALLLSELATNAILHARSSFTVIIRYDGSSLRVEVGDGSRSEPRRHLRVAGDTPSGRGLMLIDTMASRWGTLPTARGKRVWFELPVPSARRPA